MKKPPDFLKFNFVLHNLIQKSRGNVRRKAMRDIKMREKRTICKMVEAFYRRRDRGSVIEAGSKLMRPRPRDLGLEFDIP